MADDTRTVPSTAWDRTTKPTALWNDLQQQAHSDEERACLAAATRQADRVWVALHSNLLKTTAKPNADKASKPTGAAVVPARSADWHRLALSAYEVLRESGAYGHLANLRPFACAAVEPILAEWLASNADDGRTVAQQFGVGEPVHALNGDTQMAHLATLLDAAQDAAVFGIPRHRVELVAAARTDDSGTVMRVVVDTPSGIALASEPLQLPVLLDPTATGTDAATGALRRIAEVATALSIAHAKAVWQSPPPMPTVERGGTATGRAFPELRLDQRAAPPVPTTPAPPPRPATAARGVNDPKPTGRPR